MLGHKHPASYPFRLRYPNDLERVAQPAAIAGTITTPWRVVMLGADLNTLVNSDLVPNLCPPADPKLFPQGVRTDWVKPKPKRRGYTSGQTRKWKKAMVQVAPGQTIPIFRGLEGSE